MYAKLKPVQVLGKTLDVLNVSVVNYSLGTSKPTLGYFVVSSSGETITQGSMQLDKETYDSWTTNDEILLQYVASNLDIEIESVSTISKTSDEYLREDPSLETR